MINYTGRIDKGWGYEQIFASTYDYCGKLLCFTKANAQCSMHFHVKKDETWYVQSGLFKVEWIDTKTTITHSKLLPVGSTWRNERFQPHRLICLEPGEIVEVSTADNMEDNYKIMPGDSQSGS